MDGFETIIFEKQEQVGYVTLNRPRALNVYNLKMRDELYQVLAAIRDDPDIRVVIFRGAGERAFCAGADLTEFLTAPSPVVARQVRWERDIWGRFLGIPKVLIAALHGYVLGSGIEIALCCDIRIATEDARFGLPEVGLGIIPAAGGSQTLPRIAGRARSLEMLLTGRLITADEACRMGLVTRVVSRAELLTEVQKLAEKIRGYHPAAMYAKQSINRGVDLGLEEGLELESRLARLVFASRQSGSSAMTVQNFAV